MHKSRLFCGGILLRRFPFLRFWNCMADPQHQQRRQNADEKHNSIIEFQPRKQNEARQRSAEVADIHPGLQDCGNPRPPARRPGFRQNRCPHGPFAADAQRRQEPKNHQMPPGMGEIRHACESRIRENRKHQRAAAAHSIANAAENRTPQRPTDEERRLNPRGMSTDRWIVLVDAQQQRHKRRCHERVQIHVEPVE